MKFNQTHIGSLIKEEVRRRNMTFSAFAQKIGVQRQNVERKVFTQKDLSTDLLMQISELLNCNFFKHYQPIDTCNQPKLQTEVTTTVILESGEEKQSQTFKFVFGENNTELKNK